MPDFERIIDQFAVDHASNAQQRAFLQGYACGKTRARIQVAVITFTATLVILLLCPYA